MKEIAPGILTWSWFSERHGYDFNGYLIRLPGGNLAVDPVEMDDSVLEELARAGAARILLTNRNHFRAAAKLKARTGACVAVHPADAEFVRKNGVAVDEELSAGQKIGPFTVLDAHGKSPGEIALHWPERRLLIVGDAAVGKIPGALALLPPKVIEELPALQDSIRRLAQLDIDTVLVGDGASILQGGGEALRTLARSFPMSELDKLLDIMFQAHPWHGVSPGDPTGVVQAFIEIVPTDSVKYELDKPSGHLRIDRPQRFSSQPPTLYGFIPQTYCGTRVGERCAQRTGQPGMRGDRDPMDICILTEKSVAHANFLLRARPIGGLRMVDENEADDKIVAVLERDMAYGDLRDIADCPKGIVERLRHYFLTYKQMPGEKAREVRIAEVYDRVEAVEVIRLSLQDYRDTFGAPESRGVALARLLGKT